MTKTSILLAALVAILLCGCKAHSSVCPPGSVTYYDPAGPVPAAVPASVLPSTPATVEIKGRTVPVDKIVQGTLCNDAWKGTVYVGCNLQVAKWTDEPLFLKNCKLTIEEGTVVYVASHNNEAYYKGCSCHTREEVK